MNTQLQTNKKIEHFQLTLGSTLQRDEVKKSINKIDAMIVQSAASSPMLLNLTDEEAEDLLRKALAKIGLVCGIKTPPTDIETSLLINFLRKHYRTLTIAELETAFELNMIGELGEKIHHFHNLNIDFVTSVVNAYKWGRKLTAFKAFKIAENSIKTEQKNMNPKEAFESLVQLTEELGRVPDFFVWHKAYEHFKSIGLETRSLEEMKSFKKQVEKEIKSKKTQELLQSSSISERQDIERRFDDEAIRSECQRRTLKDYLEQHLRKKNAGSLFEQQT